MFTVQDLTVGDLVASMRLTVTKIQNLPAKVWDVQLMSVDGIDWDTNETVSVTVLANREIEVWE